MVSASTLLIVAGDVVLSAEYLPCTDSAGTQLVGSDCFQYNTMRRTDDPPARWFGFFPLAAACWVAVIAINTFGF